MIGSAESDRFTPGVAPADSTIERASAAPMVEPKRPRSPMLSWSRIRSGTSDDQFVEERINTRAWIPITLFSLIIAAFLFRLAAAEHLSSHVDESASVLAAEMVVEKGVPIFPSGTLYLQGATISYISAAIIGFGRGGLDDLVPLRLISVFAGTAAVLFAYLASRAMIRSSAIAVFVAGVITIDPVSIRWGGLVRMYALLQLLSLIVVWLLARALNAKPNRRELITMVVVFWIGVFTHIAICLLLPGMVIASYLTYGRSLTSSRRDLGAAIAACFGAPVVLFGLNALVSPADKSTTSSLPGVSFVGDFLFSADQILHPTVGSWTLLFRYSPIGLIVPIAILVAAALLIGRYVFGEPGRSAGVQLTRRMLTLLLALYWLPIIGVGLLATEQNERYLIHIHPFGLILLGLLVHDLLAHPFPRFVSARDALATSGGVLSAAAVARPWGSRRVAPLRPSAEPATTTGDTVRPAPATPERALPAWLTARVVGLIGLAVVSVLGAVIRINHLSHLSLWLDEGFSALYSRQAWDAVSGTRGFYSPHPPLYFTLVKVSDLFVSDELAGRLISVIAGIATIPVFYSLLMKVLDRRAAFVGSLVLALSPIHLYYSQEARMYAIVVFLVSVTYLALVSYHQTPRLRWAVVYGVAAALALWVDYSSVYALAPQAVFILVQLYRHRRDGIALFAAGSLAVLAYMPWVPQVLDSIDAANQVERRESYLGVDTSRLSTAILSMMGYAGDGSYFQSLRPSAWNRWPDSRALLIAVALPVVVLGVRMLWRRWEALAVVIGLLGTMLVGIWISLISPGFAERTVLTTSLGWAALLGAAFSGKMSRPARGIAAMSLGAVLLIQASTIGVIYNGAIKQLWRDASEDVALTAPLNFPLVTYSYGAVADTLVDIYHPGLLDGMRVITIRDGGLENVLSNGVIPEVGLTRTFDIAGGRLAEVLPEVPENDVVLYLYYTREGEPEIQAALRRIGYTRVMHNHYAAPRYQVFLDLFVRPGAQIGPAVPIDGTFGSVEAGWTLPESGAAVATPEGATSPELTLSNQVAIPNEAFMLVDAGGSGLATFTAEFRTLEPLTSVGVSVSCLSAAGVPVSTQTAEIPAISGLAGAWRPVQVTALCPPGTETVRLALANNGLGDVSFRGPTMQFLPIPENE